MRRALAVAVAAMFVAAMVHVLSPTATEPGPVPVLAAKIPYFGSSNTGNRFGKLEFVGGLQLSSDAKGFGGLSALRLFPDRNHIVALTDKCLVLTGTLERDVTGALHDLTNVVLSGLPSGPDGRPLTKSGHYDCEALEIVGGKAFIAFEKNSTIGRFTINADGTLSDFAVAIRKDKIGRLSNNRGIEAFAVFPPGTPLAGHGIAIAEDSPNPEGNHRAFIQGPVANGELSIAKRDDFAITDAAFLPNGDLVVLERRFGLRISPGVRIRRLPLAQLIPGATVDGEILVEADLTHRIDNMEGIAVTTDEAGQTYLTLVSDDNFNYFQNTILLEFRLPQ
jgi:hypothetical protein